MNAPRKKSSPSPVQCLGTVPLTTTTLEPPDPLKQQIYAKHQGGTELSFEELRATKIRKREVQESLRGEKEPDPECGRKSLPEKEKDDDGSTTTTLSVSLKKHSQSRDSPTVNASPKDSPAQIVGDGLQTKLSKEVRLSQTNQPGLYPSILPMDPLSRLPIGRKEAGTVGYREGEEILRDPKPLPPPANETDIDPLWISAVTSGHLSAYAGTRLRDEQKKEILDAELELMQSKNGGESKDNCHALEQHSEKDFKTDLQSLSVLMTNSRHKKEKENEDEMRSEKLAGLSEKQMNDSESNFVSDKAPFERLSILGEELVELLKSQAKRDHIRHKRDKMLLSQFYSYYEDHFHKKFNVKDYGHIKLKTLFESLPDIVQIVGEGPRIGITLAHANAQESGDVQHKEEEEEEEPAQNCDPSTGCCRNPPQTCSKCHKLRVIMFKRCNISSHEATNGALVIVKIEGAESLNTESKLFNVMPGKKLLQFKLRSSTLRVFDDGNIALAVLTANGPRIIPEGTVIGHCQRMSKEVTADASSLFDAVLSSGQELSLKAGLKEEAKKFSLRPRSKNCPGTLLRPFDAVLVRACREEWGEVVTVRNRLAVVRPGVWVELALKNETRHDITDIRFVNPVAQAESIDEADAKDLRMAAYWKRNNIGNSPTSTASSPEGSEQDQNLSFTKTMPPPSKVVQSVVLLDRVRTELTRRSGPYLLSLRGVPPGSKYVKVSFSVPGFLSQGTLPVYGGDRVLVSYDPELNADRRQVPLVGDVVGEWSAAAAAAAAVGDSGRKCCGGVHLYRAQRAASVAFKNPALRPRLAAVCEDDCPCIEFGHGCEIVFSKPMVKLGEDEKMAMAGRMELSVVAEVALEAGDVVFSAECCHNEKFVKKLASAC